jgi:DNA-binding NarL/FixJ family response regulator
LIRAMPVNVSIVEDDPGTREMLGALIAREPDMACLHTYATAEDAVAGVPHQPPDVLLVDINLPGKSGIECVSELKSALPDLQMLIVTTYDDSDNIFQALRAGATGYLLKRAPAAEIIAAIRDVHAGGSPMTASIARKVVAFFHKVPQKKTSGAGQLTEREEQILALLSQGLQYKEIASRIEVGVSTVRTHLHTIYVKLHVTSRAEAVEKFLRR